MTALPNVPFERSYWVVPGKLLAGCYPGDRDVDEAERKLKGLIDAGVRHVVNLMEAHEVDHKSRAFAPYEEKLAQLAREMGREIECIRIPIRDGSVPTRETMRSILDAIDGHIAQGLPVFVHCWGGKGRTGTVVGCYLVRHGLAIEKEALARIQELRRHDPTSSQASPENATQCDMVKSWKVGE